jgi:tetratricopeptide (TPR) repeat protein
MKGYLSSLYNRNICLTLLAILALPATSNAETYNFRVVYAEVPGVNEILAGNHAAAIEILESRAQDTEAYHPADETATLCALYIVSGKLTVAAGTCNKAVETDQSHTAYNNRGVLRAHLGDTTGALEDFERARVLPQNQKQYIQELMLRDARLIATNNYATAKKLVAKRSFTPSQSLANSIRGASVEDLGNQ